MEDWTWGPLPPTAPTSMCPLNLTGICRNIVVMMPGCKAQVCKFESPQAGWHGRYINMQHCEGLSMVLLQLKDSLELFMKRREFLPGSVFLSICDMTKAVEINVKSHSFLPPEPNCCDDEHSISSIFHNVLIWKSYQQNQDLLSLYLFVFQLICL